MPKKNAPESAPTSTPAENKANGKKARNGANQPAPSPKAPAITVQRKDGKIYSHVRNKWLVETPEERVRQTYLLVLVNEYGYSLDQITEEESVVGRGSGQARADFMIWRTVQDRSENKTPSLQLLPEDTVHSLRLRELSRGTPSGFEAGTILVTSTGSSLRIESSCYAGTRTILIRNSLDKVVPPVIQTMERSALSAQTLAARYFDRVSCISRFSAGLGKLEVAQLKANYREFLRDMAPIELHRLAQNCLDSTENLRNIVLLDCIRVENFGRPKDSRAFENAQLVNPIPVAEFDAAQPLLQRVVDLFNAGRAAWFDFTGNTARATALKMSQAFKMKLGEQSAPIQGA